MSFDSDVVDTKSEIVLDNPDILQKDGRFVGKSASEPPQEPDETSTSRFAAAGTVRSWHVWVLLSALLAAAFATNASGAGFLGVPFSSELSDALATYCPGPDACSYLTTGEEVLDRGFITPENHWVLNLWPPGVSIYGAVVILGDRLGLTLPLAAGIFNIVLWSAVLTAWWRYFQIRGSGILAVGTVAAIAVGQPMQGWYLGNGLFYAESAATAALLISLLLLKTGADSEGRRALSYHAGAGVFLAGAAYLRSPFEVAGLALTVFAIVGAGVALSRFLFRNRTLRGAHASVSERIPLLVFAAAFQATTIPWRFFAAWKLRPGDFRWTVAGDSGWNSSWLPTSYLEEIGAGWLIGTTRNTACLVNETKCQEIFAQEITTNAPYNGTGFTTKEFQSEAISTLLNQPIDWITIKVQAFPRFWFENIRSVDPYEFFENGLLLLALTAVLLLGYKRLDTNLYLTFLAVTAATFGPIFLFHYEARYFYPLKTTLPILTALLITHHLNERTRTQRSPHVV